jgi:Ca-activated chloride channel family protein
MPEKLILVLLSVLIVGSFFLKFIRQRRATRIAFSDYGFARINKSKILFRRWFKNTILLVAIILLSKSLFLTVLEDEGDKKIKIQKSQLNTKTLFLLDASLSMITEDVNPSRIEKAKLQIIQIMKKMPESYFALIPFAGSAYLQCPFTDDLDIIAQYLEVVNKSSISKGGSSLSSGLKLAIKLFDRSKKKDEKTKMNMVILSDGADYSGEDKDLYSEIEKRGIDVTIIGVGGDNPVPIVFMKREGMEDIVKKDNRNNIVKTKLDSDNLENIAEAMGGTFITNVDDFKMGRGSIRKSSKKTLLNDQALVRNFIIFVIVPLILLVVEILLSTRSRTKMKWAGRFCQ